MRWCFDFHDKLKSITVEDMPVLIMKFLGIRLDELS